jgi:hypothetical protein
VGGFEPPVFASRTRRIGQAFPHAVEQVDAGGRSWTRTNDPRLIKTVLYRTELCDLRMLGSPRRPRTAALPVNSRTLYPLSYRGKSAAAHCRSWNMDSTDGLLAALGLRPAAAQRPDRQAGQSEPTPAARRQFCRLPPSTTWLRRERNCDDGGGARTRTAYLRFWKPALCPLSYAPSGSLYKFGTSCTIRTCDLRFRRPALWSR